VFSFMSPLFGVTFGILVLHEPVDVFFAVGAALVLAGITVVSGPGLRRRRVAAVAPAGMQGQG
jgi:drug/metabolite transporter (DMT)-like permease